jgi:DNA helicase-2/ATP-dependent DNA helicase PcrA
MFAGAPPAGTGSRTDRYPVSLVMAVTEKINDKFREIYDQLNEQQKQAVDTIEGPVMVIAGPGTGKTQILSARIGKILLETDTAPENILCLTYTEAGVVAMRRRLLSFIGPDAYKVRIHTFHAFCNEVIQENLSLFEKTSLDPVSDLERIEYFKQLIDAFPKNHPLKRYRGDVYFEIRNLQSLFSTMKREGWTEEYINERIDTYLQDLANRPEFIYKRAYKEFKAGDLKKDKIEEEKEKMEKLRAAVNEFGKFQQIMRDHNRYDFDDMINWVIRAFQENKNLLNNYQEKFLYILVDEYQDTSGTQNKLVDLLINYWERPNIFVVGDDDQSIYRFQGANVDNMLSFTKTYKNDLLTVVLTDNYRSTQPILDVSKTLIGRNQERLIAKLQGLSKDLRSANKNISALNHLPSIKEYESQRQEMIDITLEVERLIAQGITPGRIAIIYKENKYGDDLTSYFNLRNIPVYSKRDVNILEIPLIKKIVLLFKYLAAEHDTPYGGDEMLFEILHFDWFGIPPIEIAKLTVEISSRKLSDGRISFRKHLFDRANLPPADLFSAQLPEQMRKASRILEKLIGSVPNLTLQTLFENIIREAGVLSAVMQSADRNWQIQVISAMFDFIREETQRNPFLSLQQLVSTIELMEREELVLPLVQISGSDKGVNLLTAHGSKGLEFLYVFLVGCNSSVWEKKRKPGGGYAYPDTIFSSQPKTSDDEELRRLFYVALTRAEQHLQLSYSRFRLDGRELEPSVFLAEIQELHTIPTEKVFVSADAIAQFQALYFNESLRPEIGRMEEDFISIMLDRFVMNVTALNNYLKCPLEFYFKNLIRIPSPKNEATEFGSAAHFALQRLFEKMKDNNNTFGSRAEFLSDFEFYMRRHRESFTREQFDRRMEYGLEVLGNYYDRYIHGWNRFVAIERNISNVTVEGVPLKGKLDKLEFEGKNVNVVDYKTGDPDKALEKLKPINEKNPNGGDYWRQAVFYKLLVDESKNDWKVVSVEFDFIEPDKKKAYQKRKIVINPADITSVTQQIVTVWNKIQQRDFYTGCGKEDCHWCSFVKTNNLAVALHELKEEDEQD